MDIEKRKELQSVLRELFDTFNIQAGFLMFVEHEQTDPYICELHCDEQNKLIKGIVDGVARAMAISGVKIHVNPKDK